MSDSQNQVYKDCEYYLRIVTIVQVCLKQALLDILHDPAYNGLPLHNEQQTHALLLAFKTKNGQKLNRVFDFHQWDIICHECTSCGPNCQRAGKTNTQDFDITIICALLCNYLTGLPPPSNGWFGKQPMAPGDYSKSACARRARELRNRTSGHGSYRNISTKKEFDDCYNEIEKILKGLGYNNMQLFVGLKTSSLDPYVQDRIIFFACELNTMKSKMNTMENGQDNLKTDQDTIKKEIEALRSNIEALTDTLKRHIDQSRDRRTIEATSFAICKANDDLNLVSKELKKRYQTKYGSLSLSLEPSKTPFKPVQTVGRNKIVVKLSLVRSTEVFEMDDEKEHVNMIRKKQKHLTSSSFDYKNIFEFINDPVLISRAEGRSKATLVNDDYVLISGIPGCGKTTLVETILYQWSIDELWKEEFDFAFIIYFRQLVKFKLDQTITCHKLLSHFYPDFDFSKILHHKALLILDGFDELACKEDFRKAPEEFSPFVQAVYDLVDPNSSFQFTRLLTSRPGSCPILFESIFNTAFVQNIRILKIVGLDEENIKQYVYNHLQNKDRVENLLKKVQESTVLQNFMTVPFFCWGICYLINDKELTVDKLPATATAIYANTLTLFIRNHGLRNPAARLKDLFESSNFEEMISLLSKMAWSLYKEHKLIFSSKDLKTFGDINVLLQSGLVIKVESTYGELDYFQFMHYSFQEFLCALYVFYTNEEVLNLNLNIRTMVAGLCGVKLDDNSDTIARSYISMTKNNFNFKSIFKDFLINIGHVLDLFYEFQNRTAKVFIEYLKIDSVFSPLHSEPEKLSHFLKRCDHQHLSIDVLKIDEFQFPSSNDSCCKVLASILNCCTTLECNVGVLHYLIKNFNFPKIKEGRMDRLLIYCNLMINKIDPSDISDAIASLKNVTIFIPSEDKHRMMVWLKRFVKLVEKMNDSERPRITFYGYNGLKQGVLAYKPEYLPKKIKSFPLRSWYEIVNMGDFESFMESVSSAGPPIEEINRPVRNPPKCVLI